MTNDYRKFCTKHGIVPSDHMCLRWRFHVAKLRLGWYRFWPSIATSDYKSRWGRLRRRILIALGRCPGCGMKRPCQLDLEFEIRAEKL